ncbi:acetyl-CoA hydrolase/transferase C-terminal domain-containing protein [Bacillus sp. 1P10SD]|uniref:acetyl-CoA hydrolase/transferase family protein n=1 Tax=Bacillus sp. 1P10SD TaxID=3132265 RepID=UPI0039A5FFEA
MPIVLNAKDVPSLFHANMNVFIQGNVSEPKAVIQALKEDSNASNGVNYISTIFPGLNRTDWAGLHENASLTCFFMSRDLKESFSKGKVQFIPLHLNEIYQYLESSAVVDLAIIQVSSPDPWGYCSLGVSADFVPAILQKAKIIVAEVNSQMPRTSGEPPVHIGTFDYIVHADYPLPEMQEGKRSADMKKIGEYAASLISDGDTLQFGIGSVPDAILYALNEKKDLGIHSGMISDAVVDLVESGAINGSQKSVDRGKIVTGIAVGSKRLYDFVNNNPLIDFRPVNYTHSLEVIKEIDNFISINSAIEMDLYGQVNGETMKGVQFGGTGGQGNFIRGAKLSSGGKSIIAFLSTAGNGKISKITPTLGAGNIITTPRTDVQYVITENGIANLQNQSLQKRAEALISIAAPQFREELLSDWNKEIEKWQG